MPAPYSIAAAEVYEKPRLRKIGLNRLICWLMPPPLLRAAQRLSSAGTAIGAPDARAPARPENPSPFPDRRSRPEHRYWTRGIAAVRYPAPAAPAAALLSACGCTGV